ncbi:inter-alpha-trypsin inhibitor heavy chain H3 [Trichechus manatus latirostris]|uniref:Inter-alpha-trypsin inhibitor heavy chain H3 n=1 Tax=Trichechus manatus latirostris TaxID=127582 RepID=A0A2Y9D6T6_TRIMA|nr:inter-alpha-trypsin inhibitor heavy chain H3 [Trichechus manatus latirostris]
MTPALWSCLVLVLLSGLAASGFPRSPFRPLRKRSLPEGVVDSTEVYSTKISCKVTSRFAHNVVTTRAVNRAEKAKEVSFDVELPKTAFITNFTLTIDGVTYPGTVKEKEVAKKQYEKAVSQGKTAGLVKASGRKLEKFTVSVNVAAGSKVTFELTYEELLKRHKGKYKMYLKVQPKQLVKHFEIEADIFEPQGISMLDAEASFITNDLLGSALTKSFSGKKGRVSFKPSLEQQRSCPTCTDSLLNGDFTITYDVNRESPANVQIVNGYFVHFFAPQGLPSVPKNVVFVIDTSGSMHGQKIQQTRDALLKILEDMKKEDYLNFILFSGYVTNWKDSLVQATPENLQEARTFVRNIQSSGMTNINDGLLRGISMLNKAREEHTVPERSTSIIIMLTDGDANVGESGGCGSKNAYGEEKENLRARALDLSLKYHFVTPLTSMVVTKPEDNEDQTAIADKPGEGGHRESAIPSMAYLTNYQPPQTPYYYVDGDPHFIIQVAEKDDAICFNIDEDPGTVLCLIQDPVTGLTVNGKIIGDKIASPDSQTRKTYFGKLGIANAQMDLRIEVTTEKIILWNGAVQSTFSWLDTVTVTQDGLSVTINRKKNMAVSFGDGITFVVVLHQMWKKHPVHHDFLGFYVVDSHRMSAQTHGLLGQFFHPFDFKVSDIHPGSDPTKPVATMVVKNHQLTVTRGSQKDYREDAGIGTKVVCWFVHNNGQGLIDGTHTDYIVPSLF